MKIVKKVLAIVVYILFEKSGSFLNLTELIKWKMQYFLKVSTLPLLESSSFIYFQSIVLKLFAQNLFWKKLMNLLKIITSCSFICFVRYFKNLILFILNVYETMSTRLFLQFHMSHAILHPLSHLSAIY